MYKYNAVIRRWIDGDTVELDVDLGFYTHRFVTVRLKDVDAPETRGENKEQGMKIWHWCIARWPVGYKVTLHSDRDKFSRSFARWVGMVTDGETGYLINDVINQYITRGKE